MAHVVCYGSYGSYGTVDKKFFSERHVPSVTHFHNISHYVLCLIAFCGGKWNYPT